MILCCRDDCRCSPRSRGHEPEGQQSKNEEGNGQLPEAHGDKARCPFAGRTQPLRGQRVFASPARQHVGLRVLVGAAVAAGKHSRLCTRLHRHFRAILQFMSGETDVLVWLFGQILATLKVLWKAHFQDTCLLLIPKPCG